MFHKTTFLKVSQNSQESSCVGVSFSCNFNKKRGSGTVGFCEFCEISLTSKYKAKMYANLIYVCIYMYQTCCIVDKKLFTTNVAVVL